MKIRVAGVALDVPPTVAIFDDDRPHPVYHAGSEGLFGARVTACGRLISSPNYHGFDRHGFEIATRHAVKFARPCATCWRELRRHPSLFSRRPGPGATRHEQEVLT